MSRIPEPLATIHDSLTETDPSSTLDEARAVLLLVAARHHPKAVAYYTAIARNAGYSSYLREVRHEQQRRPQ